MPCQPWLIRSENGLNKKPSSNRDVLVQTGGQYVIVLEGNADILIPGRRSSGRHTPITERA